MLLQLGMRLPHTHAAVAWERGYLTLMLLQLGIRLPHTHAAANWLATSVKNLTLRSCDRFEVQMVLLWDPYIS